MTRDRAEARLLSRILRLGLLLALLGQIAWSFRPEPSRAQTDQQAQGQALYDFGHDGSRYAVDRVFAMAELASSLQNDAVPELKKALGDTDSGVRYWAALGLRMRGEKAVMTALAE